MQKAINPRWVLLAITLKSFCLGVLALLPRLRRFRPRRPDAWIF
jgi:hypothetical protein